MTGRLAYMEIMCTPNRERTDGRTVAGRRRPAPGLTIVELLVVISVIGVLAGLLVPAIGIVRKNSQVAAAKGTVDRLTMAMEAYQQLDDRHRYPLHEVLFVTPAPAPAVVGLDAVGASCPSGVLGLLLDDQLYAFDRSTMGRNVVDPWNAPVLYQLKRPTPAANASRLEADWNWDQAKGRERAWDAARDQPSPYPYVYSVGPSGSAGDAGTWIYHAR